MSEFEVSRRITVHASPEAILPELVDFRRWQAWSPWEGVDPELERTYSGSNSGVGAHYAWSGNRKAGRGSMEITSVSPGEVGLDLVFLKPFKAENKIRFVLVPDGSSTEVRWIMSGRNETLLSKAFSKLVPMDRIVGKDFERGLAELKRVAEGSPAAG